MAVETLSPQPIFENKTSFIDRLTSLSWEEREQIMFAYDIAKFAHREQKREEGGRYFEHPRSVALILMDECNIYDASIISAALLHDAMEDSSILGSYHRLSYSEWKDIARHRITPSFKESTANIVIALTKPMVNNINIHTKEEAMNLYLSNLRDSSPETLLVKMADRLHNLRTLQFVPAEKQKMKIDETKDIYFPIFLRAMEKYPDETTYLLNEMDSVINTLQSTS